MDSAQYLQGCFQHLQLPTVAIDAKLWVALLQHLYCISMKVLCSWLFESLITWNLHARSGFGAHGVLDKAESFHHKCLVLAYGIGSASTLLFEQMSDDVEEAIKGAINVNSGGPEETTVKEFFEACTL